MGTTTRKALEIEDALGDLGTALDGGRRTRERARLLRDRSSATSTRRWRSSRTSSATPSFPASEFDREKKRHLDTLAQQEKNAERGGERACARCSRSAPTIRTAARSRACRRRSTAITRDDLAPFHDAYWKPGSSRPRLRRRRDARRSDGARRRSTSAPGRAAPRPRSRSRRRRRRPPGSSTSSTARTRRRPRDRSSCRRRSGRRRTTTRSRSPTRSAAAAGSARG